MRNVVVDPGLLDYMRASSGSCELRVVASHSPDALDALSEARRGVMAIRHPEEPSEPLVSYVSAVAEVEDGYRLTFDAADAEIYEGLLESVLDAVVSALRGAGTPATITPPPVLQVRQDPHDNAFVEISGIPNVPAGIPLPATGRVTTSGGWPVELIVVIMVEEAERNWFQNVLRAVRQAGYSIHFANENGPHSNDVKRSQVAHFDAEGVDVLLHLTWPSEPIDGARAGMVLTLRAGSATEAGRS